MLKIRDGFVLRSIVDEHVVMPVGNRMNSFSNLMVLNESGAFLWNCLKDGVADQMVLIERITEEYSVSSEEAAVDVAAFLDELKRIDVLDA